MVDWSVVQRHVAEEITLLCRQHHGEKTSGLLPAEVVVAANAAPYNRRAGVSKHYLLYYSGADVTLRFAGAEFRYEGLKDGSLVAPIMIDQLPMVAFSVLDGQLMLNFIAFDEFNQPIVRVQNNELAYVINQWDVEWIEKTLTFRTGKRQILLQLVFDPPGLITILKGRLLLNGIELLIRPNFCFLTNNQGTLSGLPVINALIGFAIGVQPNIMPAIAIRSISRYGIDVKKAKNAFRKEVAAFRRGAAALKKIPEADAKLS